MKPFDLEAAKAGAPVCTREGNRARILTFDAEGSRPIVALVREKNPDTGTYEEIPYNYFLHGQYWFSSSSKDDLVMENSQSRLLVKHEGYMNIYSRSARLSKRVAAEPGYIYYRREDAEKDIRSNERPVATIKVEWEE